MRIAIGGDHAGFTYKSRIISFLKNEKHQILDFGPDSDDSVDYPDHVHPLAKKMKNGDADLGILICGSGNGVAIVANKYQGIRAAVCWNQDAAVLARQHNDANVICLGARFLDYEHIQNIVWTFINTKFEGGRHQRRVDKIDC